ncbi:isoleucine--tRNA ligase [Hyphococcus luteus]|uniref:Isoleucine--tRNA ligase n=1 Tax=Hyphococcus luteus TaxID=2058213 RepID=A0A2S7K7N7_9PROT|nr:isoleucine--tRNA ligase [Marinicaulis flavus]PQA88478.1 isoleucine--tRNA ligase [Marinicaulis flavus]
MPDASKNGASKGAASEGRDYKDTLFLPETEFPMRAGLPKREPQWLERWAKLGMYERLRADAKGREKFILHDGPPYANGHIHMGTALTKVLKDLIVRSKQMAGYDANFVPGWDCHGLPIEWQVEREFAEKGRKKRDVPTAEFRKACRDYAQKWLDIQREEFKRLGPEGDWDNPYTTMAFASEAKIAGELLKFAELGLLYRGSKPVMWSPVEQTALAEAEIEYHDHQSTTIWVKFPVNSVILREGDEPTNWDLVSNPDDPLNVVIWTTTPWTIPGNRAICFGPKLSYSVYKVVEMQADLDFEPWAKPGERFVVADALAESVREAGLIAKWERVAELSAQQLRSMHCDHPLKGFSGGYEFDVPLLAGDHVTDEAGTGFVHTAPGHGQEDYIAWVSAFGTQKEIPHTVDEFGAFTEEAPGFTGEQVLVIEGKKKGKDGGANKAVIDQLIAHGKLLARGRLTHSYPHSWRSKAPVIFRNTPQWFIALDKPTANGKTLRENALAAIDATGFTPAAGRNRIRSMVEGRPDWLISRQRAWGVPITIFVHKETGEVLVDEAVNKRITDAITTGGADAWFETDSQDFLGADYKAGDYEKVEDILDVWFDSGSTHAFCLEEREDLKWPADVYCEGSDQHRGWFQSSLLEACGTRGRAPYDHVVTNGFVVDGEGRKMSKSLGNVMAPDEVIKQYGAEIIRIWVASSDYTDDLRISKEIIGSAVDSYRRLRNTLRYLLGALNGFEDAERLDAAEMPELERYILHRLAVLDEEVREGYDKFDFKGVWRKIFDFASLELSAFYLDVRKDSLYCDAPGDKRRRAARTVMAEVFDRLVLWLSPICVFTAEEAWLTRYPSEDGSVHLALFPETPKGWRDDALGAKWKKIREVRRVVTGALEVERREKRIGASLEAAPIVHVADADLLKAYHGLDAAELFITSGASLTGDPAPETAFRLEGESGAVAVEPVEAEGEKCARCWRILPEVGVHESHPDLCERCIDAVEAVDAKAGA